MITDKIVDYRDFIHTNTAGFVGRQWLRDKVDAFLRMDDKRYFLLSGEPGIGKTAFLAHLVAEREDFFYHFISSTDQDWDSPISFAYSIGAQLADKYGSWILQEDEELTGIRIDQHIGDVKPGGTVIGAIIQQYIGLPIEELTNRLILRSLRRLANRNGQPIALLVDAVDEATGYSVKPTICDLLIRLRSVPNLRVVLTANPGSLLQELKDQIQSVGLEDCELDDDLAENRADIRAYLEATVSEPPIQEVMASADLSPAQFIDLIATRSDGNFLYMTTVLNAIRKDRTMADLNTLPASLSGYYRMQFRRHRQEGGPDQWNRTFRPVMGVLTVSRTSLSVDQLAELSGIKRGAVNNVLATLSLCLQCRDQKGTLVYQWYHRALSDFLTSWKDNFEDWFDPQECHAWVADRIYRRFPDPVGIDEEYALRNLAYHYRRAGSKYFPHLYALITPAVRRAKWSRFGSDYVFSQDLAESIDAALEEGPLPGLPQVVRCGLVEATLGSIIADVQPDLLRALARVGKWDRALDLVRLSTDRKGPGLLAIVEGLLLEGSPSSLDLVQGVVNQIPKTGEDAADRALALGQIAVRLAEKGDKQASTLFDEAEKCVEAIPGIDTQARTLAKLARLRAPWEPDHATRTFDAALARARSLPTDVAADMRDFAGAATMVSQSVPESRWLTTHAAVDALKALAHSW